MTMKRSVVTAAILGAAAFSGSAMAGVSGNAGVVSDYVFRGIEQQAGAGAAVQGGMDYSSDLGLYAGVWSSTVKGVTNGEEIDYYGGYSAEFGGVSFDVGALAYNYPENPSFDTAEYHISASMMGATLAYYYSPDWFSAGESSQYVNAAYSYSLSDSVSLDGAVGYTFGDAWKKKNTGTKDLAYMDYSVSLTKTVTKELSASFSVVGTDRDSADNAIFTDGPKFIVGASYSFDI